MPASEVGTSWTIVRHDQDAVLAALKSGECDGILPAADGFMDRFAGFLDDLGILASFDSFPDHREGYSIAPAFFCTTLVHKALFRLDSLRKVSSVLFQSTDVLRKIGFNVRQIHEGFYANSKQRPFNEEALADYFAALEPKELQAHQAKLAKHLVAQCSELLSEGIAMIDAITVTVAPGHRNRPGIQYKICVLCLWHDGRMYPMLWDFTVRGKGEDCDLTQAKRLVKKAQRIWGKHAIKRLVVDRGFIDGAWLADLAKAQTHVVIGLKSDMCMFEDMVGLSRLPDTNWLIADPPKIRGQAPPVRTVCALKDLETWESCTTPLHGCVLRDEYKDHVAYQCIVTSDPTISGDQVHEAMRLRWGLEEAFMELTRYWRLEAFNSCRHHVAAAQAHFTLLAYALLNLYEASLDPEDDTPDIPILLGDREITVYWRDRFAIIRPSELITIVLDNVEAWQHNRHAIIEALRFTEGAHRPRGPD